MASRSWQFLQLCAKKSDQCKPEDFFSTSAVSPESCFVWLTDNLQVRGQWITSQGPWWVDPNHQNLQDGNGFGLINVVAFAALPAALNGQLDLDGATVSMLTRIDQDWVRPIGESIFGNMPARSYFWFQTHPRSLENCMPDPLIGEDCTRQSNFIYTGIFYGEVALDKSSDPKGSSINISLRSDRADYWTCLGRGVNVKYDCLPFDRAIKQVSHVGIIFGPAKECPKNINAEPGEACDLEILSKNPSEFFNPGRFEFKDFLISSQITRSDTAVLAKFGISFNIKPADSWNPMTLIDTPFLDEGSGIYLVAEANMKPLRIGMTHSLSVTGFDDASPAIYISPAGYEPGQLNSVVYAHIESSPSIYKMVTPIAYYSPGDIVGLIIWKNYILFTKNDEVIHTAPVSCGVDCKWKPYISTFENTTSSPLLYVN